MLKNKMDSVTKKKKEEEAKLRMFGTLSEDEEIKIVKSIETQE